MVTLYVWILDLAVVTVAVVGTPVTVTVTVAVVFVTIMEVLGVDRRDEQREEPTFPG